jgi:hypothetical protein
MIIRHFSGNKNNTTPIPDNEIWYTSTDRNIVTPSSTSAFDANIVSNTYENGKGIIKLNNSVHLIGGDAFRGCSSLTSVTIPNSVTSIGVFAFEGCSSLTSITIPESIRYIYTNAFGSIPATSITFNAINCADIRRYGGGYDYTFGVFNPINYKGDSCNTTLK